MGSQSNNLLDQPVAEARRPGSEGYGFASGLRSGPATEVNAPLFWAVLRDIQPGELARLEQGSLGVKPIPLVKVREVHHQIARLLAQGLRPVEVSAIVGFSQSRISILQRDPSFVELMAFYRDRKDEVGADISARLQAATLDALAILHDRMIDDPESITNDELQRAVNSGLDRLGHGTRQTLDVNFIGPAVLARLKSEARAAGEVKVRGEEATNHSPTEGTGSASSVIDVPESDIVPGPQGGSEVGRNYEASTEPHDSPPQGRTPGGTPI
jgi:hypothetical protein